MLRSIFRVISFLAAYLLLPVGAFYLGYQKTGVYFEEKLIRLPFEHFGIAIGLGCAFTVLTIAQLVWVLTHQTAKAAKSPYVVGSKTKETILK